MSASDHVRAIFDHAGRKIFDFALVNSAPASPAMRERYAEQSAEPVECDLTAVEELGVKCIAGDFIEEDHFARHATDRLCQELLELGQIGSSERGTGGLKALR